MDGDTCADFDTDSNTDSNTDLDTATNLTAREVEPSPCRICASRELHRWVHLPAMPFTEELRQPGDPVPAFLADIDVYRCADCGVSQTIHELELGGYYADYSYTTSSSGLASRFMERLAEMLFTRFKLPPGCRILEVGSGDGAQLEAFRKRGGEVLGFEPSALLCGISRARGIPVVEGLFEEDSVSRIPDTFRQADVLLMTYTFDHLPHPAGGLAVAREALHQERGLLVLEVHDLEHIVRRREYCLFEHEHFTYWTARTMKGMLERSGFKLLTTELLPERERRGNSLLIVAAPAAAAYQPDSSASAAGESSYAIDYDSFQGELERGIASLDRFVEGEIAAGRTIAGYGAGGRGVMTMAAMRSARLLAYACDANKGLHGRAAPKSFVPIAGIERLEEQPVDTLLVFSYGYMEEIVADVRSRRNAPATIISMLEVLKG
ncbi:methyltransferase domain-containing protein [Paenibacillus oenotherae]|uniref:Methyltransferase domain-containing protein n=1 Tax=Paenibacillus oenotherae TaxID=1435645 RepID=A0ABS7D0J8_9BACL|nr:class I SAM-dependent methyltransferase [Paenibacillus oenotherae]MBW7473385.1 methyltransferase domain-containing protein [Paenibacillus oenotherae]